MDENYHNLDYWYLLQKILYSDDLLNEKGIGVRKMIAQRIPLKLSKEDKKNTILYLEDFYKELGFKRE